MTNEENIYLKAMQENKRVYYAFKDKPDKWYMKQNPNIWDFEDLIYKIDPTKPTHFTEEEMEGLKSVIKALATSFDEDPV